MLRKIMGALEWVLPHAMYTSIRANFYPNLFIPIWRHSGGHKMLPIDYCRRKDDKYHLLKHGGEVPVSQAENVMTKDAGEAVVWYVDDYSSTDTWQSIKIEDQKFVPINPKAGEFAKREFQKMKELSMPSNIWNNMPKPLLWGMVGALLFGSLGFLLYVIFQFGPPSLFKPRDLIYNILLDGDKVKEGSLGVINGFRGLR